MSSAFRIGISPDFYEEAKGHFEQTVEEQLGGLAGIEAGPMPAQPGKLATPDALDQFDAVFPLALQITPESLKGVERLTVVARWGVGYDRIDVDALTANEIVLCITPNAVRRPVAEAIFTFVFALAKNLFLQDRTARAGGWRGDLPNIGMDISGTVLGSVGCGNIAQEMFRMARAFQFKRLIAADPYIRPEQVAELGVEMVDLDTVFRESDFVTVNTLLNKETEGLVGERHFRLMKPSAYFINTARGPIVQHDALLRALRERWIAGAGIDVYPTEPPPENEPLLTLDNVMVTPHALAWTQGIMRHNGIEACRNVLAVARGEIPGGVVNREVLERAGFQKKLARYRASATAAR